MPKLGMEPIRREALVEATIACIGQKGNLDVTVSQIAKRAGVSSGLAHHYFGGKDQLFLASMRHILQVFGTEVRGALSMAKTPEQRLEAVIRASFSPTNFRRETVAAWLNFYVQAQVLPDAKRLLAIYQRRLHSNLVHALRPMIGEEAPQTAETIAALIDGLYIRQAIQGPDDATDPMARAPIDLLLAHVDARLARP